jgi:hypothetical protein
MSEHTVVGTLNEVPPEPVPKKKSSRKSTKKKTAKKK